MAKFIIYDRVVDHFPSDYQYTDILPNQVVGTFCKLIEWMTNAPERFGFPEKILVKERISRNITGDVYQLDSSMFTDLGNELMEKCYDRWISCAPIYSSGRSICPYEFSNFTGTNSDVKFTEFETEFKKRCGVEPFCRPEPNLKDAYGYSVGDITGVKPLPFTGINGKDPRFE